MNELEPTLIKTSNLSIAWAKAFLFALNGGESECLTIAIRNFDGEIPTQDAKILSALEKHIEAANEIRVSKGEKPIPNVAQTALTIVPYGRWIRTGKPSLKSLSEWYIAQLLPRLKARCSKNSHGTYFERMVSYTGIKGEGKKQNVREVNQLEFVLDCWRNREKKGSRPRQSALQIACFDPAKDHTGSALSGFPCLQQISLTYKESGTLELNAYYPTQYVFDRAYGNYLGLCQLGHTLAHELGLRLSAFTCFIARPEIGWGSHEFHQSLAQKIAAQVGAAEVEGMA